MVAKQIQLVDSHCHLDRLDLTQHGGRLDAAIQAAQDAGVIHMLCVCIDLDHFPMILDIVKRYPFIDGSVGVHPCEFLGSDWEDGFLLDRLMDLGSHPRVIAIGETGLDYYHDTHERVSQQRQFRMHIRAAKALNKPLIVHTRQACADTIAILKAEGAETVGGVLHCFTEDWETAQQAMALGFYVSFSGIITFKNAQAVRSVAALVPLDRLLIETDAPYLAPVPHRGKPNEPAYVRIVAEHMAHMRGTSLEAIAAQTTQNFFDCFRVSPRKQD